MAKEFRLPREFAEKWLTALRSGEYKQASGQLICKREPLEPPSAFNRDCFCILGVACEISGTERTLWEGWGIIKSGDGMNVPAELIGDEAGSLPLRLMNMNDVGRSFSQIADWIEENVELY